MSNFEKEIIDIAKLSAAGFYHPVIGRYPEIRHFRNLKRWDFFLTVAIVGSCLMYLQMEENEKKLRSIEGKIQDQLNVFHPQAWAALQDLFRFIDATKKPPRPIILDEKAASEYLNQIIDQIALSVGFWVVLNLNGASKSENEFEISSTFANLLYKKVGVELALKYAQKAN